MSSITGAAKSRLSLFAVLMGAAAYLYLNLYAFPGTPFLLSGDQVYFWMDAERMLDGERIYRDFFQFTPPGTDLVYWALFKLFGLNVWVTNAAVLLLGCALCWICFLVARTILRPRSVALAAGVFVVLIYGRLLNGTHHWFSVLAIMGAVAVCMRTVTAAGVILSGALLGVSAFFTQSHGAAALLAFAVFLLCRALQRKEWKTLFRDEALLVAGFLGALLLLSAPFLATVGLRRLWYFQVTYVRQHVVHPVQGLSLGLPEPLAWHALLRLSPQLIVYFVLFVIYPLALWRGWTTRERSAATWDRVLLLSVAGLFLLLEVALSPNWLRFYSVSMAGIILSVWLIDQMRIARFYVTGAMWIALILAAGWQMRSTYRSQSLRMDLPAGRVATNPQRFEKLQWLMDHTRPGQLFFEANWPGMYLPLRLHNPLFVDEVATGGTSAEEVAPAILQLEGSHVEYVLWSPRLDPVDDATDRLTSLRRYLAMKYVPVQVFSDGDVILQRR